jgi:hypothetical protein
MVIGLALGPAPRANAQGASVDYQRANGLKARYESAAIDIAGQATWIGNTNLMKHNKSFDLLVVPGANHPAARGDQYTAYGDHERFDFFVTHLLGVTPPAWNKASMPASWFRLHRRLLLNTTRLRTKRPEPPA